MPNVKYLKNWKETHAQFKEEKGRMNIGLGNGKALKTFNDAILSYRPVSKQ